MEIILRTKHVLNKQTKYNLNYSVIETTGKIGIKITSIKNNNESYSKTVIFDSNKHSVEELERLIDLLAKNSVFPISLEDILEDLLT